MILTQASGITPHQCDLSAHADPSVDNISTPLASCLGDLMTLTLFGFIAAFVLLSSLSSYLIPTLILVFVTIILVLATFATFRDRVSRPLISQGWTPLVCAMIVSSGTGLILDKFVTRWEGFGALAIVLSGKHLLTPCRPE